MPSEQIPGTATLKLQEAISGLDDTIVLLQATTTFGRHPNNNVTLPRNTISRFHGRIRRDGLKYFVEDLGSSNGSFINGEPVTHRELHDQDLLTFGDVTYRFHLDQRPPSVRALGKEDSGVRLEDRPLPHELAGETLGIVEASPARDADEAISRIEREDSRENVALYLRTHYRLLDIIRHQRREDRLLKDFLELVFEVLRARRGVVLLRPEAGGNFEPMAICLAPQIDADADIPLSRTIIDLCIEKRRAILSADIPHDTRFSEADSVLSLGLLSVICVPMTDPEGVFGVCYLDSDQETEAFSEEDLHFATNLTAQVALAVENLRMLHRQEQERQLVIMGQTMAEVSHSIKNILSMTQTGSELMDHQIEQKDLEGTRRTWGSIHQGLDRMHKLVRDMLNYSRKIDHQSRLSYLAQAAHAVEQEARAQLEQAGIALEIDCDPATSPSLLDPEWLHDALMNLVLNARDALEGRTDGRIRIEVRPLDNQRNEIAVVDNGPGIPAEHRGRVFLPFFSTKGEKGNGMGLAMVSKYAREMGGEALVESEPDQGARFRLLFPACKQDQAEMTIPPRD